MKIKVSDYIADFLASKNITQVFTIVGGGAMYLNDSFGHHKKLNCIYQHHEQACSMAAEGYAKAVNKIAVVCVTGGPGAVNALNGVVGAYQDSIPMLVISGQVKSGLLEKNSGLPLRTLGGQEVDIVSAIGKMTKYAETILDAYKVRYCLEKAYLLAISGRPGPCWLDIPVDIQGTVIETEKLSGYNMEAEEQLASHVLEEQAEKVLQRFVISKRPVIYAGNGIRLSKGMHCFGKLLEKLQIPVVTCWDSIDLISSEHPLYCGRGGTMGDRAGNFAVQNSDFLLCIGNRLSVYQVGYQVDTWAREAYVIDVDIDMAELKKSTIRVDFPICADAREFMELLIKKVEQIPKESFAMRDHDHEKWRERCRNWREKYPVVQPKHRATNSLTNVYAFMDALSRIIPDGSITVVANGSASVVGSQSYHIGYESRFIMNCAISSMGWGLPAAVGAAVAVKDEKVICIEGDGSIMMNLQELQTIATNNLPILIFVINNNGYHQIRLTQNNLFHNGMIGIGPESADLGFPSFQKLADAFGIEYAMIKGNSELESVLPGVVKMEGPVLCEVFVDPAQVFEPKSATKRLADGSLYSPPLEDMEPYLSRSELKENMLIPLVEEI